MKSPYPWFGGKSAVAPMVWERLGNVTNYVEPFFGSGAVLLSRPSDPDIETVNDLDGMVANFWRATQADPDAVAQWADWPVNENDLHARHAWLVGQKDSLQVALEGDPSYHDAKIAGWWLWGICQWIGSGWCSGVGPWRQVDGSLVRVVDGGPGVNRKLPHLGNAGHGINRKLPHLGDAGKGINRNAKADGDEVWGEHLQHMMRQLRDRLRRVRVCCGDWSRVLGSTPTEKLGMTGVFLDPPYSLEADRDMGLYAVEDGSVAHGVRKWAIANGDNPLMRIVLCGYDSEHDMPDSWDAVAWKSKGGYGNIAQGESKGKSNAYREMLWFSPHCLPPTQQRLL